MESQGSNENGLPTYEEIQIKLEKDFFDENLTHYTEQVENACIIPSDDSAREILSDEFVEQSLIDGNKGEHFTSHQSEECTVGIQTTTSDREESLKSGVGKKKNKSILKKKSKNAQKKHFHYETFSRRSTKKSNVNESVRTHTFDKRPFECDLNKLTRINTSEKRFKCEVCGKTLTQKANLNVHARTHNGERPFECKVCGKGFTCQSHLNRHTRLHTREKPFDCEFCGKAFSDKSNLNRHKLTHNIERIFNCRIIQT